MNTQQTKKWTQSIPERPLLTTHPRFGLPGWLGQRDMLNEYKNYALGRTKTTLADLVTLLLAGAFLGGMFYYAFTF